MKIRAIIEDTFYECLGKKTLIGFFLLSTLGIIVLCWVTNVQVDVGGGGMKLFLGKEIDLEGAAWLRDIIVKTEATFSVALYGIGIFISIFATADLVPSMLQKGKLDLYLARPVSRARLLIGKLLGAVAVVAVNIFYAIAGIWLVFGIRTGVWNLRFLFAAVTIVFMFAVLYTVMLLVGVLVRNTALAIIVPYVLIMLNPVLDKRETWLPLVSSKFLRFLVETIYQITPKFSGISGMTKDLVEGNPIQSWTPVLSNLLIALVVMNLAVYIFSKKDY